MRITLCEGGREFFFFFFFFLSLPLPGTLKFKTHKSFELPTPSLAEVKASAQKCNLWGAGGQGNERPGLVFFF